MNYVFIIIVVVTNEAQLKDLNISNQNLWRGI